MGVRIACPWQMIFLWYWPLGRCFYCPSMWPPKAFSRSLVFSMSTEIDRIWCDMCKHQTSTHATNANTRLRQFRTDSCRLCVSSAILLLCLLVCRVARSSLVYFGYAQRQALRPEADVALRWRLRELYINVHPECPEACVTCARVCVRKKYLWT